MWYNERVNHIKSSRALERTCYHFSTDVKGIDTMPHHTTPTKKCTRCREVLPATLEFFAPNKRSEKLRNWCLVCVGEYEAQNPTRVSDVRREYMREYRNRTGARERMRLSQVRYYKANFSVFRAATQRRRARKRNAVGSHTAEDIDAQYQAQKGRCYYCKEKVGQQYHVDHAVPLSRGGSDGPENLVIACPTCNLQKNNKLPHEWAQGGRLL